MSFDSNIGWVLHVSAAATSRVLGWALQVSTKASHQPLELLLLDEVDAGEAVDVGFGQAGEVAVPRHADGVERRLGGPQPLVPIFMERRELQNTLGIQQRRLGANANNKDDLLDYYRVYLLE